MLTTITDTDGDEEDEQEDCEGADVFRNAYFLTSTHMIKTKAPQLRPSGQDAKEHTPRRHDILHSVRLRMT